MAGKLPFFNFIDKSMKDLQTQWAAILNPTIAITKLFNAQPPKIIALTASGNNSVFNTPAGAFYLKIRMCGSGGGGQGSGTAAGTNAAIGTSTTFGINLLTATGGSVSTVLGAGPPAGGSASVISPAISNFTLGGGAGSPGGTNGTGAAVFPGGEGGANPLGGSGAGGTAGGGGVAGLPNTGAGGGGGGDNNIANGNSGNGGGAGGYLEAIIPAPAASYPYFIAAGGAGGGAGTNGRAGGNGGSGIIVVEVYFQ